MIPIDGMQRILIDFGIFVLLTCLAEWLRWAFWKLRIVRWVVSLAFSAMKIVLLAVRSLS